MLITDLVKRLAQDRRRWRYLLMGAFVLPILLVLPHARSLIVRNAVATAYLHELRAPVTGVVTSVSLYPGQHVNDSSGAIRVHNDRLDRGRVARLEVALAGHKVEVERKRNQLQSLRDLAAKRRSELAQYEKSVEQDLGKQLQMLDDEASARQATLVEAESNLGRVQKLFEAELLSQSDVETAEAIFQQARSDHSANQLERKRLRQQLEEVRGGVFQVEIPDGVLLTRQSVDSLDVEIMAMENAVGSALSALDETAAELEASSRAFDQATTATVELPEGNTVWDVHVAPGVWVEAGTPLASFVDCSELLLDIAVDDATLALIEPGLETRLRLFGSFQYYEGEVVLVRGSAGITDVSHFAAEVENRGNRKGRVLARFKDPEMTLKSGSSCGIGRTAYAEFEGIGLLELVLFPLFR